MCRRIVRFFEEVAKAKGWAWSALVSDLKRERRWQEGHTVGMVDDGFVVAETGPIGFGN